MTTIHTTTYLNNNQYLKRKREEEEDSNFIPQKISKISNEVISQAHSNLAPMEITSQDDFNFIKPETVAPILSIKIKDEPEEAANTSTSFGLSLPMEDINPNEDELQPELPDLIEIVNQSDEDVHIEEVISENEVEEIEEAGTVKSTRYSSSIKGCLYFYKQRTAFKASLLMFNRCDLPYVIQKTQSQYATLLDYHSTATMIKRIEKSSEKEKKSYLNAFLKENPSLKKKEVLPISTEELLESWTGDEFFRLCSALEFYADRNQKPNWEVISLFVGTKSVRSCYLRSRYLKHKTYLDASSTWTRWELYSFIELMSFHNKTGIFWKYVQKIIPTKTLKLLKTRFTKMNKISFPKETLHFPSNANQSNSSTNPFFDICEKYNYADWNKISHEYSTLTSKKLSSSECQKIYKDLHALQGSHADLSHQAIWSTQEIQLLQEAISSTEDSEINWEEVATLMDSKSASECETKSHWLTLRKIGSAKSQYILEVQLHLGCILYYYKYTIAKNGETDKKIDFNFDYSKKKLEKHFADFEFSQRDIDYLIKQARQLSDQDQNLCIQEFLKQNPTLIGLSSTPSSENSWNEEELHALKNAYNEYTLQKKAPNWVKISQKVETKDALQCKNAIFANSDFTNSYSLGAILFIQQYSQFFGPVNDDYIPQKYEKHLKQKLTQNELNEKLKSISTMSDEDKTSSIAAFLENNKELKKKYEFCESVSQISDNHLEPVESTISRWSEEEVWKLKLLVKMHRHKSEYWKSISQKLQTKTPLQCQDKFSALRKKKRKANLG